MGNKKKPKPQPSRPASGRKPDLKTAGRAGVAVAGTSWKNIHLKMGLFMFVVAFAIYAQTLSYDFTLDDRIVIFENQLTMQGVKAIPEIFARPYLYGSVIPDDIIYRPVSKALFALCWSISAGDPMVFHLTSVFFYALTGFLLFLVLARYFPKNLYVPLITSLLFITHPLHTEVVNNVKSLDEITCFFFFILSLYFMHDYLSGKKWTYLLLAVLSFFVSFLSKESGITYLAVFPLVAYFYGARKNKIISLTAGMAGAVAVVFLIRTIVLDGMKVNPPLAIDNILAGTGDFMIQRITAIALMGKYFLLLIFPHPLVCDYSTRQLGLTNAGDWRFIVSLIITLALLTFAVMRFRKKDWLNFCILFFFITFSITSNIFFLGGSHFAERFMYAPSLGFCMAVALLADRFINRSREGKKPSTLKALFQARPLLMVVSVMISVFFIIKVVIQNPVWKNNISLFEHGIKYSPNSYRVHMALASNLADEKNLQKADAAEKQKIKGRAIRLMKKGLSLHAYPNGYDLLGNTYYKTGQYDSAFHAYEQGLQLSPDNESLNHHAGKALDKIKKYREAIPYLEKALAKNPGNDGALFNMGLSYTNMGDVATGLKYFLRLTEVKPERADGWHYAGLIYSAMGDAVKAKEYTEKAASLGGVKED